MRCRYTLPQLVLCAALAGCAAAPSTVSAPVVDTSGITVSDEYGVPAKARILGYVKGISCAHSLLPDAATKDAALADLKLEAARMGATAVAHLRNRKRGFSASCVYSLVAEGLAYRLP